MKYCSCKGYTSSKTKLEFHNFETVEVAPLKVVPMQSTLSTTVEFNDRVVEEPVIIVPKVVKKVEPVRAAPVRKPSPPKVFAKTFEPRKNWVRLGHLGKFDGVDHFSHKTDVLSINQLVESLKIGKSFLNSVPKSSKENIKQIWKGLGALSYSEIASNPNFDLDQEYLFGEKEYMHGTVKGRQDLLSACKYIGQLSSGKEPHGIGRFVYQNGSIYEGQWYNGQRDGYGRFIQEDGKHFVGQWRNGSRLE